MSRLCPHANVVHCPLYHGAHVPGGPSCDDGRCDEGGCGVDRGTVDYAAAVAEFLAKYPREFAELEFAEAAAQIADQRRRNMRAVH